MSTKAWREANREKLASRRKAYYEANKEKAASQVKAYREANKEKVAAQDKARSKANNAAMCKALSDSYVAHKLHLRVAELTPELLAMKREQLLLHRLGKQIKAQLKDET